MSRLVKSDIRFIKDDIDTYDDCFKNQTGYFMHDVAKKVANLSKISGIYRTAVVSVTSGLGIISGFAEAVCAILKHCSIDAFVTEACDVDGIYEAITNRADIVFMADDSRFVAFGVSTRAIVENGECTGAGFAEALVCAMRDRREKVLVLGASTVGRAAAYYLLGKGIPVDLYDTDVSVFANVDMHRKGLTNLENPPILKEYRYIYDATTSADFITADDVSADTVISAPGMPCGITEEARSIATVIHNSLELGVITMYYECIRIVQSHQRKCDC
jgi:pyrrolysine biosynthesis protein PylD